MLTLVDVHKQLGGQAVLHGVDLQVPRGSTTVLIGPSGCGKSTLLRLMNGLLWPDGGEVHFDGTRLAVDNVLTSRRRMGYVIQGGGLFPHLTAKENITLAARQFGMERSRINPRLEELRELTSLSRDVLDRYGSGISGGQRQRVALMRALFLDPELLLLDEPLGALDPMIRRDLQEDLRHVFGSLGKAVVLVTHDLAEAAFFADEVILLQDGAVVQRGAFRDLIDRPATGFVKEFVNAQRSTWLTGGG